MYQGWKNWGTWNAALHLNNEEPAYRDRVERMEQTGQATSFLARRVYQDHFPNGTPDMEGDSCLDQIDFDEIAEDWNEL